MYEVVRAGSLGWQSVGKVMECRKSRINDLKSKVMELRSGLGRIRNWEVNAVEVATSKSSGVSKCGEVD